ncbi:FAD-dependent oxidoreductase [soil metagenome]
MNHLQHYDFLIAGQGLAGSLLAYELIRSGKKVLVVDERAKENSSRIAAGMIHPVTGRRLSKSWRADLFIATAINRYQELEQLSGKKLFHEIPVLEIFSDHGNRNDWLGKTTDPEFNRFIGEECTPNLIHPAIIAPLGGQWVHHGGWLDMVLFLDTMYTYFLANESFCEGRIESGDVQFLSDGVQWKNIQATKLINCGGNATTQDPFWKWIPFIPAKGELLVIACDHLPKDYIIHHTVKVIPLIDNKFKIGATYTWNEKDNLPTEAGKLKLIDGLSKTINVPYSIIDHQAGIRPSTHDRRAYLGAHPHFPQLAIFNGLGSKGVMEGPWLAAKMAAFLLGKDSLELDYSIERCLEKFESTQ